MTNDKKQEIKQAINFVIYRLGEVSRYDFSEVMKSVYNINRCGINVEPLIKCLIDEEQIIFVKKEICMCLLPLSFR
jgi:NAD-dependent DNA ligase